MEVRMGKSGSPYRVRGILRFLARENHVETGEASIRYRGLEAETRDFRDAVGKLSKTLDDCYKNAVLRVGEEKAEIFAAQKMMLTAEEFTDPVLARIAGGVCAVQAVAESASALTDTLSGMDTEYMRARAADVVQLAADLQSILRGQGEEVLAEMADRPYILAAHDLSPAQTIGMDVSRVLGFVTEGGSGTSHTAILARSMHIPAVVALGKLDPAWEGHDCIVDGEAGTLLVDPDASAIQAFTAAEAETADRAAVYGNLRHIRLRDGRGKPFPILANAGSLAEIQAALAGHGARLIMVDYDDKGRPIGVTFSIDTTAGRQGFVLAANIDGVLRVFRQQKLKEDRDQAERTAWRNLRDWVLAQMAIVEAGMADVDEVFLPYLSDGRGNTLYRVYQSSRLRLEGGHAERGAQ